MTTQLPETWAEFHARVQPKDGDKFLDDRGEVWGYKDGIYTCGIFGMHPGWHASTILSCPLKPYVEPKKVKMWSALCYTNHGWKLSGTLFDSEAEAIASYPSDCKVIWPAIPGPDGSYEIEAPNGQD